MKIVYYENHKLLPVSDKENFIWVSICYNLDTWKSFGLYPNSMIWSKSKCLKGTMFIFQFVRDGSIVYNILVSILCVLNGNILGVCESGTFLRRTSGAVFALSGKSSFQWPVIIIILYRYIFFTLCPYFCYLLHWRSNIFNYLLIYLKF